MMGAQGDVPPAGGPSVCGCSLRLGSAAGREMGIGFSFKLSG